MQVVVLSFADWWTHYLLPNCGLERNSRLRRWHRLSKDLFHGVKSGVWRSFFFHWNYHRRVSTWTAGCAVFKSAPSGREELNRHVRAMSVSFEIRGLRPGRPHNLPKVFVTYCANVTTKPVRRSGRTSTSLPRTRSSFSAFCFTVTHIVRVTAKGATTTRPIPSPSHQCSRRRDRQSKLRKERRTKHENESISI